MNGSRTIDWYSAAQERLTSVALAVQRQEPLDLEAVSSVAVGIVEAIKRNDQLLVHALSGPAGSSLITNLVNVGVLAAKVGAGLGYHGKDLERLTFAGLLHDIGLFAVPQSLITKTSRLTQDERMLIEQHPELGYQAIRKAGPSYDWLAQVVRQSHERWNGQGYPNKLKGRQINELAQIIGVVDVFDALVSPRGYRRRFFPHEAVRELIVAERTAFPREVIKALVEQLSAYPLGTSVRLTTGETGSVIRINTNYALRPVVWIEGDTARGQEPRQLDLSLTPLVSIVETLEPPDVARLSHFEQEMSRSKMEVAPSASDQFSSLLEGLDALATAIQGAVVSKPSVSEKTVRPAVVASNAAVQQPAQDREDAGFVKEVIGLFALEAHEWLSQIQMALTQLGTGANGTVRPRLYGILMQGLSNLAKSAATVQCFHIEQMASGLIPVLYKISHQDSREITGTLQALQDGVDRIGLAVRRLAGNQEDSPAGVEPGPGSTHSVSLSPSPVTRREPDDIMQAQSSGAVVSGAPLLCALRDLQQARARSVQPARDVLEAVIHRAEREVHHLDATSVERILSEMERLDEEFLHEVRERVPSMSRALAALRMQGVTDFVTMSQLDPIVQQVEALYDLASHAHATAVTMFLQGLRAFLMVAAYRKTATLPQRLETLDSRIHALIPMVEQWVNLGRV
ncbi:MAG: HD domain-containing protein, partial [Nitrospira sp.]|nr:HD domain-containing protein [Nitrospira sp.]